MLVACAIALACGVRTEPPGEDDTDGPVTSGPQGPDPREGGCDVPFELPFINGVWRGRVKGPGRVKGHCGDGENDGGAEDTYLIVPTFNTDVLVFVLPETEFDPVLRVTRNGCYEDDNNPPRLCVTGAKSQQYWHFLAEAGQEYSLTIDSPTDTDGRYALQIIYGAPEITACPVHMTQIHQMPGGFFTWSNKLGGKGGRVDGFCGGPGAENMFQLNVVYPGLVTVQVRADDRFAPVLSLRTGCGASTEITCTSMEQQGSSSFALTEFLSPGTYFVVVDQGGVAGGEYVLEVFTE